mmetsp:Transcript_5183/g.4374  ORF Transcript_5183/g.4374 Transcript_5183/m.4374 type:complete len:142 (-) Transcript_5183:22-447(-)|eukprot:CAMPEP_0205828442 /NCGR_PEP_ID=MMETSP0206-20130828/35122_1 /ASSEMBLY_ACC=CAM_ASM_000279 /TAXON_ID=36767 /ORGANISM="Euplotes focardii, Strain TN1" /LENGTH=141 /DNA_ID=CAMNT_0053130259 /DNA_START=416 /DNA_END=841 /DNA_ORIENTATION=+
MGLSKNDEELKSNGVTINSDSDDEAADREMNESEKKVMNEFKENDKELEEIALQIANSLGELGEKQNMVGVSINQQYEMLQKANENADNTELELNRQNNEISRLLNKFRNGKQLWLDFFMLFILMGLLALLWNRLKARGYI